MTKTCGYTGSSGWTSWYYAGNNTNNMVVAISITGSLLVMPESGYITRVWIFAAGDGISVDSEIFVDYNGYIVDMYCKLPAGSRSVGGQSWNSVSPSNPPFLPSGAHFNVGFWRSPSENALWSSKNYANNQWDDGYVATAPSQGGGLGSHSIYGGAALGAYIEYTPAAPIINSVSPTAAAPNNTFTISGAAFQSVSSVTINGAGCSFTINSDSQLTVTVPFGATTGSLLVTNPNGTTNGGTFTVEGQPQISSMSPTSGTIGSTFTVTGNYFSTINSVTINGTAASYSISSDTSITITVPAGATQGAVNLANSYGTTSAGTFTPLAAPAPSSLSTSSGTFGSTFTVAGHYFNGVSSVTLNGQGCSYTVNSDTQVTVTVPTSSTQGAVILTNPYGQGNAGTFTPFAAPSVSALSPTVGGTGTSATITGHYFTGTSSVTVNGVSASFAINSDATVTFTVPTSASTGSVIITNPRGSANAGTFTVNNSPAITSYTPAGGVANTVITLNGLHFTGVSAATINGQAATFSVSSDSVMTVTIPVYATTGPLVITNASGATTAGNVQVYDPLVWNNTSEASGEAFVWNNSAWVQPTTITEFNGAIWTN